MTKKIGIQLFLFLCIPFFVVLFNSYSKLKEEYFQETRSYKDPILAYEDQLQPLSSYATSSYYQHRLSDYYENNPNFLLLDKHGNVKETFTSRDWLSYWNLQNNDILAIDRSYKDSQSFDEQNVYYSLNIPKIYREQVRFAFEQNAPNAYFYFDGKINKEKSNSHFSYYDVTYLEVANKVVFGQNTKNNTPLSGDAILVLAADGLLVYKQNYSNFLEKSISFISIDLLKQSFSSELSKENLAQLDGPTFYANHRINENIYDLSIVPICNLKHEVLGYFVRFNETSHPHYYLFYIFIERYGSMIFALLLAMVIFAFIMAYTITKPISLIYDQTRRIIAGNYHFRIQETGHDEITKLAHSINEMSDQLEVTLKQLNNEIATVQRLNEVQTKFTANFTHEIKTPLAIIHGFCELLEFEQDPSKQQEYHHIIMQEVNKINQIVYAMLELSKLKSGKLPLNKQVSDLAEIIYTTLESFEVTLQKKKLRIDNQIENVEVEMDVFKMEMVIRNFMSNSIKYAYNQSTIHICLNEHVFSIENEGPLINEDKITHLFEAFYQADHSRKEEGTGLGLAICQSILELHHFDYGVKNTTRGVCFYFVLD